MSNEMALCWLLVIAVVYLMRRVAALEARFEWLADALVRHMHAALAAETGD